MWPLAASEGWPLMRGKAKVKTVRACISPSIYCPYTYRIVSHCCKSSKYFIDIIPIFQEGDIVENLGDIVKNLGDTVENPADIMETMVTLCTLL